MTDEIRFESKIDWWVMAIPALAIVGVPVAIVFNTKPGQLTGAIVIPIAISLVVPLGIFAWLFTSTEYVVAGNDLRIRSGPVRKLVPIDSITAIERGSIESAPALSLSRVCIRYGRFDHVTISPKDMSGFIRTIVARVPNVALRDIDDYR